jgi:hypothetical protein
VTKTPAPASYSSLSIEERGVRAHSPFGDSFSSPCELDPDSHEWWTAARQVSILAPLTGFEDLQ